MPQARSLLGALAALLALLVPLAHACWASGSWPAALTVDVSGPLDKASDWIVDNRDSHPLFLYFLGYVCNAVVIAVRAVYLVLLRRGLGRRHGRRRAGRLAGRGLVRGLAVAAPLGAFAVCGLLGMWVPTMQTSP